MKGAEFRTSLPEKLIGPPEDAEGWPLPAAVGWVVAVAAGAAAVTVTVAAGAAAAVTVTVGAGAAAAVTVTVDAGAGLEPVDTAAPIPTPANSKARPARPAIEANRVLRVPWRLGGGAWRS
jgi:hypothetical protein